MIQLTIPRQINEEGKLIKTAIRNEFDNSYQFYKY